VKLSDTHHKILFFILPNEKCSRTEIGRNRTLRNLSAETIQEHIDTLLQFGFIASEIEETKMKGRPKTTYTITEVGRVYMERRNEMGSD